MDEGWGHLARRGGARVALRHRGWVGLSWACLLVASLLGSSPASAVSGAELIRGEPFRHGRFEARIQFAPGDGVVSSFFLWKDGSELPEVFWNEIDIEKLGAECTGYSSNALYGSPESNHTLDVPAAEDLCTSYHTHTLEWTPEHLSWLLDGREVRRLTGADLQAFEDNAVPGMQMRFNLWVGSAAFGGSFSPTILPVHQYINWVSYSAYTPGAGDSGTDFSAAWRDDFDAALDAGWSVGTWASPLNNSVHARANVNVVDGKAVLSLTGDDALGFSATPPADPAELAPPAEDAGTPVPGAGIAPSDNPATRSRARSSGGCSATSSPPASGGCRCWLTLGAAALWLGRRRQIGGHYRAPASGSKHLPVPAARCAVVNVRRSYPGASSTSELSQMHIVPGGHVEVEVVVVVGVRGAEQGAEDFALDQLAGELGQKIGMRRGGRIAGRLPVSVDAYLEASQERQGCRGPRWQREGRGRELEARDVDSVAERVLTELAAGASD